jgi:tetratricopeptide (TPR) repeat protein
MDYSKIPEHHVTTIGDEERAVRRKQWGRIWAVVAVVAGAAIWGWMVQRNAESASKVEATGVQARMSAEVATLEKRYRALTVGGQVSAEALAMLDQAIAAEKARQNQGGSDAPADQKFLEKLERERDDWLGQAALPRLVSLEAAAEALRAAGDWETAAETLRKALALQRAINGGSAAAQVKDYVRETRLVQALTAAEAGPGQQTVRAALAKAEAAEAAQRWAEARTAYTEARAAQLSLNQKYRGARYADAATLTRIEQKLATLPEVETGAPGR